MKASICIKYTDNCNLSKHIITIKYIIHINLIKWGAVLVQLIRRLFRGLIKIKLRSIITQRDNSKERRDNRGAAIRIMGGVVK